jgi:AcrR family transcriptional regulator
MEEVVTRKRLTREESRAQTRERLLEAAFQVFVRDGFEAAAIEDVAEAAGYSRGAFYSNFESKDDLVCALLEEQMEESQANVQAIIGAGLPPDELIRQLRQFYVAIASEPQHCMFWLGVQLYALQHPPIRPRVAALLRKDREYVVESVRNVYAALGRELPYPAELITFGLMAISQGLAMARMLDPEAISPEFVPHTLETLFNRIAGLDEPVKAGAGPSA